MRTNAVLILLLRVVRLAFSLLNLSLSAKYFGVSLDRDVWILAINTIVVFDLAIWGPLNETFRTKFLFIRAEEGEQTALSKTGGLILFTALLTSFLVMIIWLNSLSLAQIIAPAYGVEQLLVLSSMIKVVVPALLITQLTKLITAVLNCYNSFVIPEISGMITQVFTLVVLITLAPIMGIVSLAISYYFGLLLYLILLIIQLKRYHLNLFSKLRISHLRTVSTFILFSLPMFLPYLFGQLHAVIEKRIASTIKVGTVSTMDYAKKFSDIPMEVLLSIIMTMLVPILSSLYSKKDETGFVREFRKIYQLGLLLVTFIIVMFTVSPDAFINILYDKGSIAEDSLRQIVLLTTLYSWAVLSVFLYQAYGAVLLSSNKRMHYAFIGVAAQLLMISLNLAFYDSSGVYIFPISLFTSHLIASGLMAFYFPFANNRLRIVTLKYVALLTGMCSGMYYLNKLAFSLQTNSYMVLGINVIVFFVLLNGILVTFKMEERLFILGILKKLRS